MPSGRCDSIWHVISHIGEVIATNCYTPLFYLTTLPAGSGRKHILAYFEGNQTLLFAYSRPADALSSSNNVSCHITIYLSGQGRRLRGGCPQRRTAPEQLLGQSRKRLLSRLGHSPYRSLSVSAAHHPMQSLGAVCCSVRYLICGSRPSRTFKEQHIFVYAWPNGAMPLFVT